MFSKPVYHGETFPLWNTLTPDPGVIVNKSTIEIKVVSVWTRERLLASCFLIKEMQQRYTVIYTYAFMIHMGCHFSCQKVLQLICIFKDF